MTTFAHTSESVQSLIEAGIAAAKAGDAMRAHELLSEALARQPRDERAWLWLSGVVGGDAERRYCLEQVLVLDPQHPAARRGLAQLPNLAPRSPLPEPESDRPTLPGVALPAESVPHATTRTTVNLDLPAGFAPAEPERESALPASVAPPEVAELVVLALGGGRSPEEACRMLCEQHGYAWEQARDAVNAVMGQHRVRIARRQAPFLLFLGLATLLGGLGLLALGMLRWQGLGHVVYSPYYYRNMIMALGTGTLMVLGSAIGLAQVIGSLRK